MSNFEATHKYNGMDSVCSFSEGDNVVYIEEYVDERFPDNKTCAWYRKQNGHEQAVLKTCMEEL